ncbi:MAG: tRNA (adenosine(37)-N6)-threonylcarbamoyltransferase complex ATPase subunit type 1 TsaE [Alphaproteobacteria bacterium]|nr:tRNA (adenosine(37)-N6)-threonylcarbamoyltransferase complex ATPase subunit type 1 TsaE [Alphaproteobacteria bacterium]
MSSFISQNETMTGTLAGLFASLLVPSDAVLLHGGLGSGKTLFVRAVLRALADEENLDVPSPTFCLVQPYRIGGRSILHADLYRLTHASELDELGLAEDPEAILFIEWPERCPALADLATWNVAMDPGPAADEAAYGQSSVRRIEISAVNPQRSAAMTALTGAGGFTHFAPGGDSLPQNRAAPRP